jgi:hypothetical protein
LLRGLAKWLVLGLVMFLLVFGFLALVVHLFYLPPDENYPFWQVAGLVVFVGLATFFMNAVANWLKRVLFPEKRKG